jgi:hypothetical protein
MSAHDATAPPLVLANVAATFRCARQLESSSLRSGNQIVEAMAVRSYSSVPPITNNRTIRMMGSISIVLFGWPAPITKVMVSVRRLAVRCACAAGYVKTSC